MNDLHYMRTVSGRKIFILDPRPEDFLIEDIAHHLSLTMRYNGGTIFPFSVARHSIIMAQNVPDEFRLEALLHDAHEMSIGDNTSPLKASIPELRAVEKLHEKAMREAFGLPEKMSYIVKDADLRMYATEVKQLRPGSVLEDATSAYHGICPYDVKLVERNWLDDKQMFLELFRDLTRNRRDG